MGRTRGTPGRLAVAVVLALSLAAGITPWVHPGVAAAVSAATVLVHQGNVTGGPGDQFSGTGTAASVSTSWARSGEPATSIAIGTRSGADLAVGGYAIGNWSGATAFVNFGGSSCWGGQLEVFEAPVFDGQGHLTAFAADITPGPDGGCPATTMRVGSSLPTPVLRPSATNLAFSNQAAGTTSTQQLTYRNVGSVPIDLGAFAIGPAQYQSGSDMFTVSATTCTGALAVASTCDVTVAYTPTTWSSHGGVLSPAGTPTPIGGTVTVNGSGFFPNPSNDAIADAAEIGSLPYAYYANAAVATTDRLDPVCDGGYEHTLWFHYHATTSEPVTISTAGSVGFSNATDTVLGVYTGVPPDGLVPLVCQDNVSDVDLTSVARFPAVAGTDYWIVASQGQTGIISDLILKATVGTDDLGVEVSAWAVSPTTVYPYPDGYRDAALTTATLAEPAWVTIDVVAAAAPSVVVRHADLGQVDGAYAWRWDGRNNAGSIVAAGSYLLRHRYTDVFGNITAHDVPVTVSAKRLVWLTTTKTLNGSQTYDRYHNKSKGASYLSGTTVVLKSSTGYAYATYRFTLNSAIAYRTVRFQVVGKSTTGRKATLEIWDTEMGGWSWRTRIGPAYGTWKMPSVPGPSHTYGRYAYGKIEVRNSSGTVNWIVSKARLTYTYAVLQ